jgi:hypothetical protein
MSSPATSLIRQPQKRIIIGDEFFGSSVNPNVWTVTNPDSANGITYVLDEGFVWKCAHSSASNIPVSSNYLSSNGDISREDYLVVSFDQYYNCTTLNLSQFELILWADDNNKIYVANDATTNTMSLRIKVGGVLITNVSTSIIGSRYKMIVDYRTQVASGWVWDPSLTSSGSTDGAWSLITSASISTLPARATKIHFGAEDQSGRNGGNFCKLASLYVTNYDYTQYSPVYYQLDQWVSNYLVNTGITDLAQIAALDTFVKADRHAGRWHRKGAIYPFIGGTAALHKFSLKSNGLFQGIFNGGVTHDANGVTFNGTTGYMQTGFIDSLQMPLNQYTLSVYSRTNNSGTITDIGTIVAATQRSQVLARNGSNQLLCDSYGTTTGRITAANSDSSGLITATRRSSTDAQAYRNGVSLGSISAAQGTQPNTEFFIGAVNTAGVASNFSSRNYAHAEICWGGFTTAEALANYNNIQALQTALSRQV